MKRIFSIISCLILPWLALAQTPGDSILASERTIDRPLTVHSGQLRVSGGYAFIVNSKRFDVDGNSLDLSDEGLTNIGHKVALEVNYGFFEFLQASLWIDHIQQAQRSRNVALIVTPEDPVNLNPVTELKGWSDLRLTLDFKVPFVTRKFDFVGSVGRSFTTAAHEPDQPDHEITNSAGFTNVTYRSLNKAGDGVGAWLFAAKAKIRGDRLALSLFYDLNIYSEEGESITWRSRMDQGQIMYTNQAYAYQLGERMNYLFQLEYQAFSFLNIFLGYHLHRREEGWSEITGQRVVVPEQRLSSLLSGAEVLITPRLWLRQDLTLPLDGENTMAPLILSTRISYNLFPFK